MIYGIGALLFTVIVYGPFLWVRYVMWKHSKEMPGMPGTGGELARHLVERFELPGVEVERGEVDANHYNPGKRLVSLSPDVHDGRSLTAVAVAAHEVGHAIQFARNEPVSQLRGRYLGKAFVIKQIGAGVMVVTPILAVLFKSPAVMVFAVGVGIVTMLASALMYVAILPEEYDASFRKALPILNEGYVPGEHMPAVRQVLRAAALTYVAGAFADVIRLWRWIRFLR